MLREEKIQESVYISKWVDYSNKYGLGYQLTNGSVGVLFNDGTKMVLAPDQEYVVVQCNFLIRVSQFYCLFQAYRVH